MPYSSFEIDNVYTPDYILFGTPILKYVTLTPVFTVISGTTTIELFDDFNLNVICILKPAPSYDSINIGALYAPGYIINGKSLDLPN